MWKAKTAILMPEHEPIVGWMFTGLGGTRNLARSLMFHYDVEPGQHPDILAGFADALGEELLSFTRHTLAEYGIEVA